MNYVEQKEMENIVAVISDAVLAAAPAKKGVDGSDLRRAVGVLRASSAATSDLYTYASLLLTALEAARDAGATYRTMSAVRLAALSLTVETLIAQEAVTATVRLSLAQEARLVVAIDFRSRDDANRLAIEMNEAFQEAADASADAMQAGDHMAIIAVQAAVTKYFADRARLLPRIIAFEFARTMPTTKMSQRIYSTGDRDVELRDENKIVHPAFAPSKVRGLAV